MRAITLLLAGALGAGCHGAEPAAPGALPSLPASLRLVGDAVTTDTTGATATCHLELLLSLQHESPRTPAAREWTGTFGGELARTVLASDGSGLGFFADLAGEVRVRVTAPDSLEVRLPANDSADGRAWRALARLAGTVDASAHGAGEWACAPLDIHQGGYVDTALTAPGTWRLNQAGAAP